VAGCAACGTTPSITRASLPAYDYAAFTGAQPNDAAPPQLHLLPDAQRLSPHALRAALRGSADALVVDVRPRQHFDIAHIPGMAASAPPGRPHVHPRACVGARHLMACAPPGAHAGSLSCPFDVSRPDDFRSHIPAVCAAASAAQDPAGGHEVAAPEARNGSSGARARAYAPLHEYAVGHDTDGAAGAAVLPDMGVSRAPGSSPAAASTCSTAGGPMPAGRRPAVSDAQAVHGDNADGAECRDAGRPVYVVCRRGNDSQRAVQALRSAGIPALDMEGGLQAWAAVADPAFPLI